MPSKIRQKPTKLLPFCRPKAIRAKEEESTSSSLLNLPPPILLRIISALDPTSSILLGLTCKSLFALHRQLHPCPINLLSEFLAGRPLIGLLQPWAEPLVLYFDSEGGEEGKRMRVVFAWEAEEGRWTRTGLTVEHEISANTIQFALLLLTLHPTTQKTAQEELAKIFKGLILTMSPRKQRTSNRPRIVKLRKLFFPTPTIRNNAKVTKNFSPTKKAKPVVTTTTKPRNLHPHYQTNNQPPTPPQPPSSSSFSRSSTTCLPTPQQHPPS
ncbi:hypothetical protein G7Y89_g5271 [Cudoniella acicularis]|uniref:F-box domain-containing protein n=1 Tax=Cudoniella acicularis TaxID=354080 RepID=A0A8H4W6M6_9HELO|nr:hypothetical protein G7Y89_g5271 [Cudoniella acicularis]